MSGRSINKIILFVFVGTRPLLGPPARCHYPVTCTNFAIAELEQKPLLKALWSITKRIFSCHPLNRYNNWPANWLNSLRSLVCK